MSRRHLDDFLASRSPEEGAERQAITASLAVLKHKSILDAKDIDTLAVIAENGKSARDRVRAAETLAQMRQRAADALAHVTGTREEVLDAKGLTPNAPQSVTFNFANMDPERLKALAEGKPLNLPPPKVVDVELANPDLEEPQG